MGKGLQWPAPWHRGFGWVGNWLASTLWLADGRNTGSHLTPEPGPTLSPESDPPWPPTPHWVPITCSARDIRLPAGSRENGQCYKKPEIPLFPLPRQLLAQNTGWGSGICHGKQRAGNKFPNCHMLTETHVTSVQGCGCRRFLPGPPKLVASLLPPQGRGRRSAKQ